MGESIKNSIISFGIFLIFLITGLIVMPWLKSQFITGNEGLKALGTEQSASSFFDVQTSVFLLFALVVLVVFLYNFLTWFSVCYNDFHRLKNNCEGSLNKIQVAMKKRFDLIMQLNQATAAFSHFEQETLKEVTQMRTCIENAAPDEIQNIEFESKVLTNRLFTVVENYPELKTSSVVLNIMCSINLIENEIAKHRTEYNSITQEFNILMDTIPYKFVGRIIGLHKLEYLIFEEKIISIPSGNRQ